MPPYLGELMAFQVKRTHHQTLLSMWVTAMLTFMSLCALHGRYGVIKVAHWFLIFAFRDSISEVDCNIGVYSGIGHCFADPYKLFSVLHSLTRQVLYRCFTSIVSHSQGLIDSATPFSFSWELAISTCLSGGSIMLITAPRRQLSSSWPAV